MEIVNKQLASSGLNDCTISIKIHFLFSHLEKFTKNLGDVSDEQGACQQRWDIHMMVVYCWSLKKTFLISIILENLENENFYLQNLTSFGCKVYVYLIMPFFLTQDTPFWKSGDIFRGKSLPLRTQTQVHFAINSRIFTGATDTQKYNIWDNKCHHLSTGLQLCYRKNKINCKLWDFSKSSHPVKKYSDAMA